MIDRVSEGQGANPLRLRREEEKESRRRQILDAAERVIVRGGWDSAHFGEVAKEARLSRSLVYFYFKTRDELFHAVCERGLIELESRFKEAIAHEPLGIEQVMALGRTYHRFAIECPLYFDLLSNLQARETPEGERSPIEMAADTQGRNCLAQLAQALARGIADGSIRKSLGDPVQAAVTYWAFTHGLIQIVSKKETMLQRDMATNSEKTMDHGFAVMRESLRAPVE